MLKYKVVSIIICAILFFNNIIYAQNLNDKTVKKQIQVEDNSSIHRQHRGRRHQNRNRFGKQAKKCIITGTIKDSKTNEALPGVNVNIVDTNLGSATNKDGSFCIKRLPVGTYTIRASMMGYELMEQEIKLDPGQTAQLNFALNESVFEMNEIVVTGTGTPKLYKNVPVKTTVISRRIIEARNSENLADVLSLQTGVRVENNCQNCNFTQVRLLGLEGHYSQILVDSDPVISSLAGVYGLEQFPEEMIERVEVVKGGGSALYGGMAVAGVVNLITNRPTHNNVNVNYKNGSINGKADHQVGLTLSHMSRSERSSGYVFASARRRDHYDHNGDGFSEIGNLENESFGINWYFKPRQDGEFYVKVHHLHEDRRGGNKFDLPPHEADIAEAIESWRYGGTLGWTQKPTALFDYKAYFSFAYTERETYYGAEQDPNAYGQTTNPLYITGLQINYRLSRHLLTAGVQYQMESLKDEAIAYSRIIDDDYSNMGVILQDQVPLDDNRTAELIFGTRLDKHSELNNAILSPRAVLKWAFLEDLTFRGGVSTGFKPPQVFDEDLHITQVGGEGQIIRNTDDLKEERSTTWYGGFEYQDIISDLGLRVSLSGFYTGLSNTFMLDEMDDPNTEEFEFYRINGEGARVRGIEAEIGLQLRSIVLTGGLTWQKSEWDEAEPDFNSKNIFRTPNLYGFVSLSYDMSSRMNMLFATNYTGRMYMPHYAGYIVDDRLEHTDSFLTFDLNCSYKLPILSGHSFVKLSAGVYNITNAFQDDFDKGVARDAGYVYGPTVPRRFLVGLSIGH